MIRFSVIQPSRTCLGRLRGFTLIELLVTLTIAALLLLVVGASFVQVLEKKRLKLAAETVAADIRFFKQEGLKRRTSNFRFNIIDGADWCYGIDTGACTCTTDDDCSVRQVSGSGYNGIASIASTYSSYAFNWVRGTMSSGSITFNSTNGYDLRVVISGLGRTHICSPSDNVGGYSSC